MTRHGYLAYAFAAVLVARAATAAPPTAPSSLNTCQNAVKTATAAFVNNEIGAISTCLQAVSTQLVKNTAPDPRFAAATCVSRFRKLYDSRGHGRQLRRVRGCSEESEQLMARSFRLFATSRQP